MHTRLNSLTKRVDNDDDDDHDEIVYFSVR